VLNEEIGYIVDMGADLRLNSPVQSMKQLLGSKEFDAIFVGSGAPKGKELELPGRHDTDRIHIGIAWLESVAFAHTDKIGERVLIIGVGNTAMDCCRTSLRLGAKDVKVMARKPREFFKASAWELEDAEHETVPSWTSGHFNPRCPRCSSAATRRSARRTSSGRWSTGIKPPSRYTSFA